MLIILGVVSILSVYHIVRFFGEIVEYRLEKLNKICFAGSRIMDVETCLFIKRSPNGSFLLIVGHGLSFPNAFTLPDEITFSQTAFNQYTDGPDDIEIMRPAHGIIKAKYIAGVSKIILGLDEIDFMVFSRQDRGIVGQRECEAFMALSDVQNMILAIERTKLTDSFDPKKH